MTDRARDGHDDSGTETHEHGGEYRKPKSMAAPLFVAAIIVYALAASSSPVTDTSLAYRLGQAFGYTIFVGGVVFAISGRRRNPVGWWKIPLVLLPVAFIGISVAAGKQNQEFSKVLNNVTTAGERFIDSERHQFSIKHSGSSGPAGEMERVVIDVMTRLAEDAQNYTRELNATGFANLFSASNLRSRSDIPAINTKLAEARRIIARYRALHEQRLVQMAEGIQRANLDPSFKAEAMAGYEKSLADNKGRAQQIWQKEDEVVKAHQILAAFLEGSRWTRDGEKFIFVGQDDVGSFDKHIAEIDRISREQQQLIAQQQASFRGHANDLRTP